MKLKFSATSASYNEALDGEIIQFAFDENTDKDPLIPQSKTVSASISYEFPPCELLFYWADGAKSDGGQKAQSYTISDYEFSVMLEDGMSIEVEHSSDVKTVQKIRELLRREVGAPAKK